MNLDESVIAPAFKKTQSKLARVKSSIVMTTTVMLLLSEVFSGAIRYYFAKSGLISLIYLPKSLALILVLIGIFKIRNTRGYVFAWFIFLITICIAFSYGANISNIAFSIFVFTPFLFSLLYGSFFIKNLKQFDKLVILCYVSCVIGVLLDYSVDLPWKGFAYKIGDLAVEGNREWSSMGVDRLAGFARLSPSLASMLALFSYFLLNRVNNIFGKILLILLTLTGIFLTTSKVTLASYLIVLVYTFTFTSYRMKMNFIAVLIAIGLFLPILSVVYKFSVSNRINSDIEVMILGSFDDRLVNTWPGVFDILEKKNALFTGTGLGTVGSTVNNYPIKNMGGRILKNLSLVDSTPLFLFAVFGVIGLFLYVYHYIILSNLLKRDEDIFVSMELTIVCALILGWTSDVFSDSVPAFLIGFSVYLSATLAKKPHRKLLEE